MGDFYIMKKLKSSDGTLIAYEKTGEGPPLVLVHGDTADHTHWKMVLPTLAKYFTVYTIDRRGRGKSGDAADYKLELEIDDVVAVLDMIEEPVILLGHSGGGLISLEAALRTKNLSKLILYEPQGIYGADEPETIAKIESILREDGNEQALLFFLEKVVGIPSNEVDMYRQTPYWNVLVNATPTLPREMKAETEYKFESTRFKDLNIPTMLLYGSESRLSDKKATKMLDKSLPKSMITKLEGQAHDAITTAPDLFTEEVLKFIQSD